MAWVLIFTFLMMFVEIIVGSMSRSMALLADGWHMASHAGALFVTWLAYRLSRSPSLNRKLSFGAGKLIPLGGYTSALFLGLIAVWMGVESVVRLKNPQPIQYGEAIEVAILGLAVNLISAWALKGHGHGHHAGHSHDHEHEHSHEEHVHDELFQDHNMRSAYVHVLADALTSILAIAALAIGRWKGWLWCDAAVGLIGAVVILNWSVQLVRDTVWELLDAHSNTIDREAVAKFLESQGARVVDFHVWRVAPRAIACELRVKSKQARGADFYRALLREEFHLQHLVIEESVE
jgi:cation diffusion facilitator family transporter